MFNLVDSDGRKVTMKNGQPFTYSSRDLARMGKRFLEAERKATFKLVDAS